jgi:hypothetical protein
MKTERGIVKTETGPVETEYQRAARTLFELVKRQHEEAVEELLRGLANSLEAAGKLTPGRPLDEFLTCITVSDKPGVTSFVAVKRTSRSESPPVYRVTTALDGNAWETRVEQVGESFAATLKETRRKVRRRGTA